MAARNHSYIRDFAFLGRGRTQALPALLFATVNHRVLAGDYSPAPNEQNCFIY
ncbi:unnamed protein product [Staurois parvus]|uniref:Uncharacterized protein n=1 Tax=Staurois parvus TaxID=386267 RepID=A0ABN9BE00_9NEOB|nr:unnamed protein product [Staurois parvus]